MIKVLDYEEVDALLALLRISSSREMVALQVDRVYGSLVFYPLASSKGHFIVPLNGVVVRDEQHDVVSTADVENMLVEAAGTMGPCIVSIANGAVVLESEYTKVSISLVFSKPGVWSRFSA